MRNRSCVTLVIAEIVALFCILTMALLAHPASPKTKWAAGRCDAADLRAGVGEVGQKLLGDALDREDTGPSLARQPRPDISRQREDGLEAGKGIAEDCKADPNGLLFAIVDKHVRRIAEAAIDAGS